MRVAKITEFALVTLLAVVVPGGESYSISESNMALFKTDTNTTVARVVLVSVLNSAMMDSEK